MQIRVADAKRGEACANKSQLVLVLLLIKLHKDASFVKPILSGKGGGVGAMLNVNSSDLTLQNLRFEILTWPCCEAESSKRCLLPLKWID